MMLSNILDPGFNEASPVVDIQAPTNLYLGMDVSR